MKKISKKKSAVPPTSLPIVQEPAPVYRSVKAIPVLKDFTYTEFKKIADKAPFSLTEWAAILHLSERTLQRYSKNDGMFTPIHAERVMHIAKVLEQARLTFGSVQNFYQWLKEEPRMLEGSLSLGSLSSYDGIQKVLTQLSRIQYGVLA